MEITTLNKRHSKILTQFNKCIDRFIYESTENYSYNMFRNFKPLRSKAVALHNFLGKDIGSDNGTNNLSLSEWVFMFPNFMLFGAIGFSLSLKNGNNDEELDVLTDDLVDEMQQTIMALDEMLDEHIFENEITDEVITLITNKTKRNDKLNNRRGRKKDKS
tara:strand:+ start:518 stop:1000 length:483 start_codon:yes stop_codon:yes gene_type:complete